MDSLIDFEKCRDFINDYGGTDAKMKIQYKDEVYLLKFGQKLGRNADNPLQASYSNSVISEYLGSHVFGMLGIPAQETVLGTYKGQIAVACKDFVRNRDDANNVSLIEFKKLATGYVDNPYEVEKMPSYEALSAVFDNHSYLEPIRDMAKKRYWEMFIVDALVGNFSRSSDDWGYMYNKEEDCLFDLAPVYDCGESFYSQLSQEGMLFFINNPERLKEEINSSLMSFIRVCKEKIKYCEFFSLPESTECKKIMVDLCERIDLSKIYELINNAPGLSDIQKAFYVLWIDLREKEVLRPALKLAIGEA